MNRLFGSVLLIIGTAIGGGMLALPVVTAGLSWHFTLALLLLACVSMALGALYMAEVNAWFHRDNNLISMAKHTLGPVGEWLTWIIYLGLLYALMAAYMTGGASILGGLLGFVHLDLGHGVNAIIFTVALGAVVWHGIHSVDRVNRIFMSAKILALIILIGLISPHNHWEYLPQTGYTLKNNALIIMIASFGFAASLPSLCSYLEYNKREIQLAIIIGSVVTLLCYLIWIFTIHGTIDSTLLQPLNHSDKTAEALAQRLAKIAQSAALTTFAHLFVAVCMVTSFINVSLGLSDFLADGLRRPKSKHKVLIFSITFLPPLLITLFYPSIFVLALSYAGIFCVILLMLLPALMAWRGRYGMGKKPHQVLGGKIILSLLLICSLALVVYAVIQKMQ